MNHRDMQPVRPERDDRTVEIQQAHARSAELSQPPTDLEVAAACGRALARPNLLTARVEHVRDELRREHTRALDLVGDVPVVVRLGVLVLELEDIARTMKEER